MEQKFLLLNSPIFLPDYLQFSSHDPWKLITTSEKVKSIKVSNLTNRIYRNKIKLKEYSSVYLWAKWAQNPFYFVSPLYLSLNEQCTWNCNISNTSNKISSEIKFFNIRYKFLNIFHRKWKFFLHSFRISRFLK